MVHHEFVLCIFPNSVGEMQKRYLRFDEIDGAEVSVLTPEKPTLTAEKTKSLDPTDVEKAAGQKT